jgi:hypothetical protein
MRSSCASRSSNPLAGVVLLGALLASAPALAQVTSLGATNLGPADPALAGDVAYDDKHDVLLQVWVHDNARPKRSPCSSSAPTASRRAPQRLLV